VAAAERLEGGRQIVFDRGTVMLGFSLSTLMTNGCPKILQPHHRRVRKEAVTRSGRTAFVGYSVVLSRLPGCPRAWRSSDTTARKRDAWLAVRRPIRRARRGLLGDVPRARRATHRAILRGVIPPLLGGAVPRAMAV
jgi:hypothetical protein